MPLSGTVRLGLSMASAGRWVWVFLLSSLYRLHAVAGCAGIDRTECAMVIRAMVTEDSPKPATENCWASVHIYSTRSRTALLLCSSRAA